MKAKEIQELKLVSPIPPSVNHYLVPKIYYDKKSRRYKVIMYETTEAKAYKRLFSAYVREEAEKQGWIKSENKYQQIYCDCVYYFDRIDNDSNNRWKLSLDAITEAGNVWIDDNAVCERTNAIYYDAKNPRIEMTLHFSEHVGIFDDVEQVENFEEKCELCTRYKDGRCSILIKSLEGRILEEVNENKECIKYKERIKK